jgi:GcrA cell cycle regulator
MSEIWPEEHSRALTGFLESGLTRGGAADALNRLFKTSYTRNAVIGRAARMELPLADKPARDPKTRTKRPRRNSGPQVQKINRNRQGDHHAVLKISAGGNGSLVVTKSRRSDHIPNLRCVEVVPKAILLTDLEPHHCRYPYDGIGGAPTTYCGHDNHQFFRLDGSLRTSSYCRPHRAVTVVSPKTESMVAA